MLFLTYAYGLAPVLVARSALEEVREYEHPHRDEYGLEVVLGPVKCALEEPPHDHDWYDLAAFENCLDGEGDKLQSVVLRPGTEGVGEGAGGKGEEGGG